MLAGARLPLGTADQLPRQLALHPATPTALRWGRRRDDDQGDARDEQEQDGEHGGQTLVPVSTSKKRVSRSRSVKSIGATSFAKSARYPLNARFSWRGAIGRCS